MFPEEGVRPVLPRKESMTALEATQGQMDVVLSQLSFKCYLPEVASVGD